jgi:hypothetical protein
MLRVLPKQFSQIAASIETLPDVNSMTMEDLVCLLKPSEDCIVVEGITEQMGCLMLTEKEWLSMYHHRLPGESSSSSSGGDRVGGSNLAKQKGGGSKKNHVAKLTTEGTPRRKGHCRNFGIYGHWKLDCKRPKKDHWEESHHVQMEAVEQPTLLLAMVNTMRAEQFPHSLQPANQQVAHLNEEKV